MVFRARIRVAGKLGLASGAPVGDVNLFNAMGSINAVLDVDGWFQ
jgi:hypothetical protein